jgi:hypothetical protein
MATIYTRATKGSALSWAEGDANITNLNTAKIELTNLSVTDSGGDGSLSYNNTTGVFTYTGPSASEVRAHFTAGTGITIVNGLITNTVTDTNTTYAVSAETTTGGVNLRLTGSDASTDDVKLAQGSNITLTRTDANTITIAAAGSSGITDLVQDTTPQLGGNLDTLGNQIRAEGENSIFLVAGGTGSIILAMQLGAGVSLTDKGTQVQKLLYNEKIHSLGTTSGTVAPDVGVNGNIQTITLNGNLTINGFNNAFTGESVTLIINTGGTGRTLTSTMKFAGGEKTLSTTNTTDILSIFYDGTNYWASLGKDFK